MKPIVVVGASGLAKEVYTIIKTQNAFEPKWDFLGFVDVQNKGKEIIDGYKIIGDDAFVVRELPEIAVAIAQGFPAMRRRLFTWYAQNSRVSFPLLAHPAVVWDADNVSVGPGSILMPASVISPGVRIGKGTLIGAHVLLAHDVQVGDFCVCNPAANLSGNVIVEDDCLLGSGSVVHQGVRMEQGVTLGLGAALTRTAKSGHTYFGNPAKKIT